MDICFLFVDVFEVEGVEFVFVDIEFFEFLEL